MGRADRPIAFVTALVVACAVGCVGPRGQTVLTIVTDLPPWPVDGVHGPRYANTLEVEVFAHGALLDTRRISVDRATAWPVSFGLAPASGTLRVRMRLFSSRVRVPGCPVAINGVPACELAPGVDAGPWASDAVETDAGPDAIPLCAGGRDPRERLGITRIIDVTPPERGIDRVRVVLSGRCMGAPSDLASGASCLAPNDPSMPAAQVAPTEGIERAGDAPDATVVVPRPWFETPCAGSPRAETGVRDEEVCAPGGFFFLGDDRLDGLACHDDCYSSPERVVRLAPFYMDRYEVTVARWRAALAAGFVPPAGSYRQRTDNAQCTFSTDTTRDQLPMNCVSWSGAAAFCAFDGGRSLPSEAQWEFVASGRGAEFTWPWGDDPPTCAMAAYARAPLAVGELGTFGECHTATDNGPALVGSKPGDMSRPTATGPGVMDLGANLSEWTLDLSGGLCNPYWRVPVTPIDPVQPIAEYGPQRHTVKGGAWNAAADTLSVGQRTGIDDGDIVRNGSWIGFRCVRTGAP